MAKIAVIDIGTNSIHMVLAEIQPDAGYKILDRFKDMTRLGNGAFTTHHLSDEAITRGLDVIRNLVTLARTRATIASSPSPPVPCAKQKTGETLSISWPNRRG